MPRRFTYSLGLKEQEILAGLLKEFRKRSHVTQQTVADHFGMKRPFVAKLESGKQRVDVIEFIQFMEAIGIQPVDAFLELHRRISGDENGTSRAPRGS